MTDKISTLEELFLYELSDIHNAEKQMTVALPKLAKAATDKKLSQAFLGHLDETKGQIERIKEIVETYKLKLRSEKCEAMEGLVKEGKEAIDEVEPGPVLDVALIVAAQKVEHYEIAGYGNLIELAKILGYDKAVDLLSETLKEEKGANHKLTGLGEGGINDEANMQQAA